MACCVDSNGDFIPLGANFVKCLTKDYAEYVINITAPGSVYWTIVKRYSQFHALHEKLVKHHELVGINIPPKKAFNNLAADFLYQRQCDLQIYLRALLTRYSTLPLPKPLADFIEWHKYEIHGITDDMAKKLYKYDETILSGGYPFEFTVFQIYTINQRMLSVAPTNITSETGTDFGNVMEFINRIESIKIPSPVDKFEQSNIVMKNLEFDLSSFHSLKRLEMDAIDIRKMKGFIQLKKTLTTLVIHRSLDDLRHFMLGDLYSIGKGEWVFGDDPVSTTGWDKVITADFSQNNLHGLDPSVALMRNLETLNLSNNGLTEVSHLDVLPRLTVLKLSNNKLGLLDEYSSQESTPSSASKWNNKAAVNSLEDSSSLLVAANPSVCLHTRLGNIKELRLDGNKLKTALIVDRLYSLQILDLSNNEIASYVDILCLGRLKCLEYLYLHSNPISSETNYRRDVFHTLSDHFTQVHLDDKLPDKSEIEMVQLLHAIKKGQSNNLDTMRRAPTLYPSTSTHMTCTIKLPFQTFSSGVNISNLSNKNSRHELSLHNGKLQNFILYSFFTTTGQHHTVDHLYWVIARTMNNTEISDPQPMLLAISAQDATVLPFRILRVKTYQKNTTLPLSSCSALSPYDDDDFMRSELAINLSPCSPIYTQQYGVQIIADTDHQFLRIDQLLPDDHDSNKVRTDLFHLKMNSSEEKEVVHRHQSLGRRLCGDSPAHECGSYVVRGAGVTASRQTGAAVSLLDSLTRENNSRYSLNLDVNFLSASNRQFELLLFVNHLRVSEQHLGPLEELTLCLRGLLRFESGYTAIYAIILTPDSLYLIDERLNAIPKPPVPNKADWGSYASPPARSLSERTFSNQFSGTSFPNFGRMGVFLLKKISFLPLDFSNTNSMSKSKLNLPFPDYSHRLLIKLQESRNSSFSDQSSQSSSHRKHQPSLSSLHRRPSSPVKRKSSSLAQNMVTNLDIGFDQVEDWQEFCEKLSRFMTAINSNFGDDAEDLSSTLKSTVTPSTSLKTSESSPAISSKDVIDNKTGSTIEMMSFRNYDKSRVAARVKLISHPKLRRLAAKSPNELTRWFKSCLVECHGKKKFNVEVEDLIPNKTIITGNNSSTTKKSHNRKQTDDNILEVLWTTCIVLLPCRDELDDGQLDGSSSEICLLIGGRDSLYLIREEVRPVRESAPEADRHQDPTRELTAIEICHFTGNKLVIGVGLYHQWLWICACTQRHKSPSCEVVLMTGSSEMTSCIMDYIRRVASLHMQSRKINLFTEKMSRDKNDDNPPTITSSDSERSELVYLEEESDFETASSDSGETDAGNVEELAAGLFEIHHDLPSWSNIESLMHIISEMSDDSNTCLHHLSLIEEARLNFNELRDTSSSGCDAFVLIVLLTNTQVYIVQCSLLKNWSPSNHQHSAFRVLACQPLFDLEALTVTSYDTRVILLRFARLPDRFSPDHFDNYFSADREGLDVPLEAHLMEIVSTSEESRVLLVRQLEQACAQARQERSSREGHWRSIQGLKINLN